MKGHWLDQAGFSIDTPVTARVMEGCLVLTTDKQQDDCIKN
jgi:toxic protein SymE